MSHRTATLEPVPSTTDHEPPAARRSPLFAVLPFIGAGIFAFHLVQILTGPRTGDWKQDIVLYGVIDMIGITGVGAGISHIFFRKATARSIGWESGPFQYEVGCADLAFGITACLAASYSPDFWLAAIIASSAYRLGCTVGHLRSWIADGNTASNNTVILLNDVVVPLFLLGAWFAWA